LVAPAGSPTNTIYDSLTEGLTPLIPFQFSTTAYDIIGIAIEPTSTATKFVVFATDGVTLYLIGLDFSQVYTRTCDVSKDYETWSPSDLANERSCLMGHNVTYRRRNATAECFNPVGIDKKLSSTNCSCSEEDWECDVNYERPEGTTQCNLEGVEVYPPTYCSGVYYKTAGFRKEPGNTCVGGVDHSPAGPFDCPNAGDEGSKKMWIVAVVVIPFILIVCLVAIVAVKSDTVREKLPFLKFLATWKVGYFGMASEPDTMDVEITDSRDPDHHQLLDVEEEEEAPKKAAVATKKDQHMDDFNPRAE